jgi:hypothetical protein
MPWLTNTRENSESQLVYDEAKTILVQPRLQRL